MMAIMPAKVGELQLVPSTNIFVCEEKVDYVSFPMVG